MATIYGLHVEILSTILTLLVALSNGAADLMWLSSTCSRFLDLARQSFILKVVNFHNISMEDYKKHHHVNVLLCLCARSGNLAAESRLGKAIFHSDAFFRNITLKHDAPLSNQNADTNNGVLIHHKLVRAFIHHTSDAKLDTNLISWLLSYIESVLGHDAVFASRISIAISEMSFTISKEGWNKISCQNLCHWIPLMLTCPS